MEQMTALRAALTTRRLADHSTAWALLRAANAPVAVAVLGAHLADPRREMPSAVLINAVEADLDELRAHGFDLPQTALQYCKAWLEAGFLIRRPTESREELYSLSDGALAAIRFVQELSEPRSSVTESRLTTIVERIRQLSIETDPDVSRRIEMLRTERDRLDEEISRLASGDVEILETDRAAEQAGDVLALAAELPEDFARLRASLEALNSRLRRQLIDEPQSRGSVLDDIFRGVDLLQESEAGRSFAAFYALVLDPERTSALDDDIDALLERPFARSLTPEQRTQLRRLLPAMQDSSSEIHQVMTSLSRSLRRFVQSEELAEERQVNQLLRAATSEAHTLFEQGCRPFREIGFVLNLTRVPVSSVSALTLHDPQDAAVTEEVVESEAPPVDVAELRRSVRESEIDTAELIDAVNAVLRDHGPCTIAEVFSHRPASQGVASVVGLLDLAERHAVMVPDRHEEVRWVPADSVADARAAVLPVHLFKEPLP